MSPVAMAFLSALLFGAASPAGKILLQQLSTFQLAGLLYLGAAAALLLPVLKKRKRNWPWSAGVRGRWRLPAAIVFGGIFAPLFLLSGLALAPAASVSLWLTLESVFTVVLACAFFKEHLGRFGLIGAAGSIAAAVLLCWGEPNSATQSAFFVTAACFCWGLDNNLTSVIDGLSVSEIVFWKGLVAGTTNLIIGTLWHPQSFAIAASCGALLLGTLSYGLSLGLYVRAAQQIGAARSAMIFATAPFWGALMAAACLHEAVALNQAVAAVLFGGSLILLFADQHGHSHVHEQLEHTHSHSHDDGHHTHVHEGQPLSLRHSHAHVHDQIEHSHPHWPDLHHRHQHDA